MVAITLRVLAESQSLCLFRSARSQAARGHSIVSGRYKPNPLAVGNPIVDRAAKGSWLQPIT